MIWLLSILLFAGPWGKDAELTQGPPAVKEEPSAAARVGMKMIRFHQVVISPCDGPRSHFYPCSSQYTLTAMRKYGFAKGFIMGCDRLMRENNDPWVYRTRVVDEGEIKEDLP